MSEGNQKPESPPVQPVQGALSAPRQAQPSTRGGTRPPLQNLGRIGRFNSESIRISEDALSQAAARGN